jgi:hypothetical protein
MRVTGFRGYNSQPPRENYRDGRRWWIDRDAIEDDDVAEAAVYNVHGASPSSVCLSVFPDVQTRTSTHATELHPTIQSLPDLTSDSSSPSAHAPTASSSTMN